MFFFFSVYFLGVLVVVWCFVVWLFGFRFGYLGISLKRGVSVFFALFFRMFMLVVGDYLVMFLS